MQNNLSRVFCYSPEAGCYRQLLLVFKKHDVTLARYTRVHGVRGWAVGGWGRGEQRSGWSPVRYLEKECIPQEGGHTSRVWESRLARTWRAREPDKQWSQWTRAQCPGWVSLWFLQKGKENKNQNLMGTRQLPTAPAARGNAIVSEGFGFHLRVMGVGLQRLRAFIPQHVRLDSGPSFKWLHTHSYIQVLKTPLPLGMGKRVPGHRRALLF